MKLAVILYKTYTQLYTKACSNLYKIDTQAVQNLIPGKTTM